MTTLGNIDGGGKPPDCQPPCSGIMFGRGFFRYSVPPVVRCVCPSQRGEDRKGRMEALEVAESAERKFHDTMKEQGEAVGFGFELPSAMLLGVDVVEGRVIVTPEVASHGDIYQLIDSKAARDAVSRFQYVALATCGWAAPVNTATGEPDVAPSQHTERRRVRLFLCASSAQVSAVLRFQDDEDNPLTESEKAYQGPLADAVLGLFR